MTDTIVEITDDLSYAIIEIESQAQDSVIEVVADTVDTVIEILSTETLPGPEGIAGPTGPAGATVLTYTAGVNLSGHRMVVLDDSALVIYADITVAAHVSKVVGMTTGAAMAGADATIQTGGELIEPSWSWTLNIPIWLSTDGLLTQVAPVSGFSLIVGFPITATKIFISIREPIFLI